MGGIRMIEAIADIEKGAVNNDDENRKQEWMNK